MRITILGLAKCAKNTLEDSYSEYIENITNVSVTFKKGVHIATYPDAIEILFDDEADRVRILHCDYWRIEIE